MDGMFITNEIENRPLAGFGVIYNPPSKPEASSATVKNYLRFPMGWNPNVSTLDNK